jgi:hypothetical protein
MNTKPDENRSASPNADKHGKQGNTRGGGLGPTKSAREQHRPRTTEETLDEALEESFPASDPPARSEPIVSVGAKKKPEKKQG